MPLLKDKLDEAHEDFQIARSQAIALGAADYHDSLFDQHRARMPIDKKRPKSSRARERSGSSKHWFPLPTSRSKARGSDPGPVQVMDDASIQAKNERKYHVFKDSSVTADLTVKDLEEFEALPLVIRRKVSSAPVSLPCILSQPRPVPISIIDGFLLCEHAQRAISLHIILRSPPRSDVSPSTHGQPGPCRVGHGP
jgi:hypothetical protein